MSKLSTGLYSTVASGLKVGSWMGGDGVPLPVCDRCRHFLVRESGIGTCGPCRKAYQLQVSLRSVCPADRDETALVFLEGCFGLLEDWLGELRGIRDTGPREKRREPAEEEPLRRKVVDSPPKKQKTAHPTSPRQESSTAQSSTNRPTVASRVLPPPKAPPVPEPARAKGSLELVENSQSKEPRPSRRDQEDCVRRAPQVAHPAERPTRVSRWRSPWQRVVKQKKERRQGSQPVRLPVQEKRKRGEGAAEKRRRRKTRRGVEGGRRRPAGVPQ